MTIFFPRFLFEFYIFILVSDVFLHIFFLFQNGLFKIRSWVKRALLCDKMYFHGALNSVRCLLRWKDAYVHIVRYHSWRLNRAIRNFFGRLSSCFFSPLQPPPHISTFFVFCPNASGHVIIISYEGYKLSKLGTSYS